MKNIDSLKKGTEKVFVSLSPEEKAQYAFEEARRISLNYAEGKDVRDREKDLGLFVNKHVSSRSPEEYVRYLRALYNLSTTQLATLLIITNFSALEKEAQNLKIIIKLFDFIKENGIIAPNEDRLDAEKAAQETMEILQKRLDLVQGTINSVKKSKVWELLDDDEHQLSLSGNSTRGS